MTYRFLETCTCETTLELPLSTISSSIIALDIDSCGVYLILLTTLPQGPVNPLPSNNWHNEVGIQLQIINSLYLTFTKSLTPSLGQQLASYR